MQEAEAQGIKPSALIRQLVYDYLAETLAEGLVDSLEALKILINSCHGRHDCQVVVVVTRFREALAKDKQKRGRLLPFQPGSHQPARR